MTFKENGKVKAELQEKNGPGLSIDRDLFFQGWIMMVGYIPSLSPSG